MTNGKKVDFTPYFGSFILDTLTLGMYAESRNAIREYIQNSYDSIRSSIADGTVSSEDAAVNIIVDTEKNFVSIRDNGSGIKSSKAAETLTNIGASGKDYKTQAGFRGIGRLSGLVFCNSLIFKTKASGETIQTVVTFDAKGIRYDLSPARAPLLSMSEILEKNITVVQESSEDIDLHYFEVVMNDLHEAPIECTDIEAMRTYIGEVAPLPYRDNFIFAPQIAAAAKEQKQKLEEIRIFIHNGEDDTEGDQIFKHYENSYLVQSSKIPLSGIEIVTSPTGLWWGWLGKKDTSGMYKEDRVKAIRVRVRNIQIDGAQVIGKIFSEIEDATSYGRFNDWYIGEIFAHPERLIPNARRDGFEDLDDWIEAKNELTVLCRRLGKAAYALSIEAQGKLRVIAEQCSNLSKQADSLVQGSPDIKEISIFIAEIDKVQRKINRATKSSDNETAGQLRSLESRLLLLHKKALSKIDTGTVISSPETIANAQHDIVTKLIAAFNDEFDRPTFSKILKVIERVAGFIE